MGTGKLKFLTKKSNESAPFETLELRKVSSFDNRNNDILESIDALSKDKNANSDTVNLSNKQNKSDEGESSPSPSPNLSPNKRNKPITDNQMKSFLKKIIVKEHDKQLLLSFGINLKENDEENRNIIHRACLNLKTAIVHDILSRIKSSHMLDTQIFINAKDLFGNTPLMLACKPLAKKNSNRLSILTQLVDNGAVFKIVQPSTLWTPFHWLSFNGDEESIKYFINNYSEMIIHPDKKGDVS